jgi:hypothetical protein
MTLLGTDMAKVARLSDVASYRNGPAAQLSLRALFAGEPVFCPLIEDHDEYLARLREWRTKAMWRPWPPGAR